jgi:hypothetical protein
MPEVKKITVESNWLNLNGGLLEAPFYEKDRNSLRFVDVVKKRIYVVDLAVGPSSLKQFDLEASVGITADIEGNDNEIIVGGKRGYGLFNRTTGEHRLIKEMWNDDERKDDGGGKPKVGKHKEDRMRSNDGAVDAKGRFYVGAMNDPALVGEGFTDEGMSKYNPSLGIRHPLTTRTNRHHLPSRLRPVHSPRHPTRNDPQRYVLEPRQQNHLRYRFPLPQNHGLPLRPRNRRYRARPRKSLLRMPLRRLRAGRPRP